MSETKTVTAPGKIILVGEHAVVYGRPAIAAPVWDTTATATITGQRTGAPFVIHAHDIQQIIEVGETPSTHPLAVVATLALTHLGYQEKWPAWRIDLHSTIPIASGLGSGAAVSAALIRAIFAQAGREIDSATLSQLIYESEKLHHGTPSGIDNTVIAYGLPVWYVKGEPPTPFTPKEPLNILIGDSGIAAPTKESVADVRQAWLQDPARYERIFDQVGELSTAARGAIEAGDMGQLGQLLNQNQLLLEALQVSHPQLDQLIQAAREAGASGAKLSGGGRGGNMIALVEPETQEQVEAALKQAGAKRVIFTRIYTQPRNNVTLF